MSKKPGPGPALHLSVSGFDDSRGFTEYLIEVAEFPEDGDASAAVEAALRLCEACGAASREVVLAKEAFAAKPDVAAFPTAECDAFTPPSPPPESSPASSTKPSAWVGAGLALTLTLSLVRSRAGH